MGPSRPEPSRAGVVTITEVVKIVVQVTPRQTMQRVAQRSSRRAGPCETGDSALQRGRALSRHPVGPWRRGARTERQYAAHDERRSPVSGERVATREAIAAT